MADPSLLALPFVDLNPLIPVNAQGALTLPPISVPTEIGAHLAAIIPASPPELPAHDLS
jgi:hypothetical protein